MAGTIVADTIQDGAGNSTSMDNAIYGSAKAWASIRNGGASFTSTSYNISSITYVSTGMYTFSFTNALVDSNYAVVVGSSTNGTILNVPSPFGNNTNGARVAPTSSGFQVGVSNFAAAIQAADVMVAVFR